MTMKRCIIPSILLMLALEVAGRPSAVAVTSDEGTILLPSEGKEQVGTAAASRPWDCCDNTICTRSLPPICICLDEVDECASTCMDCVPSVSNPFRRVCGDQYFGDPGPKCTNTVAGDHNEDALKAKGDHQDSVAAAAEEEKPWECCDQVIPADVPLRGPGRAVRYNMQELRGVHLEPVPPRLQRLVQRLPRSQVHRGRRQRR
ncbi:hypothetical protein CFC21_039223 [Triticum aestivum]|uniref:Bowman-Birk serine protease inhibitors family domain-containing protein n=2 Tax=Triticum aestivum TaxID=4565 RepID=A0A9R1JRT1_WHEAT|nr:hypothetical protein CFC21_039223 [Triticum aestivum]BDI54693.1 predicted protein [Triticum aestivum]BDI54732.1 predicted protein [Triticum aestivum]BDU67346.1 Bowman-Birk type trypsin inhibitor TI1-like [Triticum aestivum]